MWPQTHHTTLIGAPGSALNHLCWECSSDISFSTYTRLLIGHATMVKGGERRSLFCVHEQKVGLGTRLQLPYNSRWYKEVDYLVCFTTLLHNLPRNTHKSTAPALTFTTVYRISSNRRGGGGFYFKSDFSDQAFI